MSLITWKIDNNYQATSLDCHTNHFSFVFISGMHTKGRHQSPEWMILSHVNCFIQGEVIGFQVLLDSLLPPLLTAMCGMMMWCETDNQATASFGYCPSTASLCLATQHDNRFPFIEMETAGMPSYYRVFQNKLHKVCYVINFEPFVLRLRD